MRCVAESHKEYFARTVGEVVPNIARVYSQFRLVGGVASAVVPRVRGVVHRAGGGLGCRCPSESATSSLVLRSVFGVKSIQRERGLGVCERDLGLGVRKVAVRRATARLNGGDHCVCGVVRGEEVKTCLGRRRGATLGCMSRLTAVVDTNYVAQGVLTRGVKDGVDNTLVKEVASDLQGECRRGEGRIGRRGRDVRGEDGVREISRGRVHGCVLGKRSSGPGLTRLCGSSPRVGRLLDIYRGFESVVGKGACSGSVEG